MLMCYICTSVAVPVVALPFLFIKQTGPFLICITSIGCDLRTSEQLGSMILNTVIVLANIIITSSGASQKGCSHYARNNQPIVWTMGLAGCSFGGVWMPCQALSVLLQSSRVLAL
jgi:hypothetical protein